MRHVISCGQEYFIADAAVAVVDDGRAPEEFFDKLQRKELRFSTWTFTEFIIPCYRNLRTGKPMRGDVPSFFTFRFMDAIAKKYGKAGLETAIQSLEKGLECREKKGFSSSNLYFYIRFYKRELDYLDRTTYGYESLV